MSFRARIYINAKETEAYIMADTNPNLKETIFKVYDTTGSDNPQEVIHQISGYQGDETFRLESLPGQTAQRTIQHHRDSVQHDDEYYNNLFLIVDRPNVSEQGVMMVNLEAYESYFDGVRVEANAAGDAVGSLSIVNTDWSENRENYSDEKTNLYPFDWFALYNRLPSQEVVSFNSALKAMNDGLGVLDLDDEDDDDDDDNDDDDGGRQPVAQREYYRAVKVTDDKNLNQIIADHAQYAETHNLDPNMFAVVDDADWKSKGMLMVKVTPEGVDMFRRKGPAAGEMLNWIYIGFMTWEEAKTWDSSTIVT